MSSKLSKSVLLEISNQLSDKQLEDLKYLCRDMVGKRDLEKADSGIKLFQLLEERGKLGADNTDCLLKLLRDINRDDLASKLCSPSGFSDDHPAEEEKAELDVATEVLSENLGRNWRKLARKLGLTDPKVDSISRRHPTELEETAREVLREWRKSRRGEARTEELIKALRACSFNMMADKVEERLSTP